MKNVREYTLRHRVWHDGMHVPLKSLFLKFITLFKNAVGFKSIIKVCIKVQVYRFQAQIYLTQNKYLCLVLILKK